MRKTALIFLFFLLIAAVACHPGNKLAHLADTSRFVYDTVHTDTDDEALLEFLTYSTYFHMVSDSDFTETQVRPGLLLQSKNTAMLNWNGEAAFGSVGDTSWISYRSYNEKVSVGRSAAISVFNFFNNEALNNNPDEYFVNKEINGSIRSRQAVVPFHFHQKKTEGWKSKGWLVMDRDSFFLSPAFMGNAAGGRNRESRNLQLGKAGAAEPIAALDFQRNPRAVYLRKDLTPQQQLQVSAYFFILLCYLK